MDLLSIASIANPIIIFIMAISLALFLIQKYGLGWKLFFIGGATYLSAQIGSILLMGFIQSSIQTGTESTALQLLLTLLLVIVLISIEETVRYAMYRWWAKDSRSWSEGMLLGAGHGGIEVIIFGVIALITVVQMIPLRTADLATIFTPENLADATNYVQAYWSKPWYEAFTDAVRSALTLPIQLSCSILVLRVFTLGSLRWLALAIAWHTLASIPLFFVSGEKFVYLPLSFLALAAAGSILLLRRFKPRQEISKI